MSTEPADASRPKESGAASGDPASATRPAGSPRAPSAFLPEPSLLDRVAIPLVRRALRTLLALPVAERVGWRLARRVRALYARRLAGASLDAPFDRTLRLCADPADFIESQILWQGVQEGDRGEVKLLRRLLRPDHVFLDVGANVGVFTLLAAKRVPRGHVHAFEPLPEHVEKLQENLRRNALQNVSVHPVALSHAPGRAELSVPVAAGLRNSGMASLYAFETGHTGLLDQIAEVADVARVRLDDYLPASVLTRLDIVKIDVEGSELDVLAGALETIRRHRPLVLLEVDASHLHRARRTVSHVVDFWRAEHYDLHRIDHRGRLRPIPSSGDDLGPHENILCRPNPRRGTPRPAGRPRASRP